MAGIYERSSPRTENTVSAHRIRYALFKYQAGHATSSQIQAYLGITPDGDPGSWADLVMIADEFLSRTGLAAKLEYLENIEATIDAIHQSIPGVDEAWMRAANQLSIPWPATGTASLTAEYEGNGVATT